MRIQVLWELTSSKVQVCGRSFLWDYRFESRRGHACLSFVSVVLSGAGLC